jgi:hypothetical protein
MEPERDWSLEALVAETRATVKHIAAELSELRNETRGDIRRIDDRLFQVMLLQIATLGTALASLAAAVVVAVAS